MQENLEKKTFKKKSWLEFESQEIFFLKYCYVGFLASSDSIRVAIFELFVQTFFENTLLSFFKLSLETNDNISSIKLVNEKMHYMWLMIIY